ncbi:MAG TPA: glycosyltransferase, partial [Pirellulales bacterium]|nr:glycosyltransferase [Pirellulales bacterium]
QALIDDEHAAGITWLTAGDQPSPGEPFRFARIERGFQPFGKWRIGNSLSFRLGGYRLAENMTIARRVAQYSDELAGIIGEVNPDALWTLALPRQILVLDHLLQRIDVPLHVSIHDDPESEARTGSRWPHTLAAAMARSWPRLLERATSVDTVSTPMRDYIQARFGRDSIVIPPAPRLPLTDSPPPALNGCLNLGMSGCWFDSEKPIQALGQGLQRARRRGLFKQANIAWLDGQRALRYPTAQQFRAALAPDEVRFLPRLAEREAVRALTACHVNYLPFWFADEVHGRTSNPSKMCLYLPAARPIIIHGPDDCMPVRFAREHGIGVVWNSLDPDTFPAVLEEVYRQLDNWPELRAGYQALLDEPMSLEKNRARFWQTMDATCQGKRFP